MSETLIARVQDRWQVSDRVVYLSSCFQQQLTFGEAQ